MERRSIGYVCLMPEFTKVWSEANIALVKLTAKLASSVHFAQSSNFSSEIKIAMIQSLRMNFQR